MPHISVSLWPGKSALQHQALSDAIVKSVVQTLGYGEDAISVGFAEVDPADWMEKVFQPEIAGRWTTLTKQPGYGPDVP
ncbi:tautomerase family protein [Erythrobacter sp. SCSIO 43205]|uniref:tautomerase family protein n=1 Tax=Erythrobacter sp. SCSIO 43205 TaxID=2779361 RepID=UPI001CA85DF8|nr:tautomerase family protein [Erythrobacter sp. SCSIO 43205]UAB79292.1 tautomerase family protein [Erythrobacter sp. SCSIO 43205]